MKKIRNYKKYIGLALALGISVTPAVQAYTQEYADHVANSHLNTFKAIEKDDVKLEKPILQKNIIETLKDIFGKTQWSNIINLGEREKREIAYKQMPHECIEKATVIDQSFVDKMELVRGEGRLEDHLLNRITTAPNGKNLLQTTVGAKRLMEILSQPSTDIEELHKHQSIIKELVHNNALRNQCNQLLADINKVEPLVFELYTQKTLTEQETYLIQSNWLLRKLDLNGTKTLSATTRVGQIGVSLAVCTTPILMPATDIFLINKYFKKYKNHPDIDQDFLDTIRKPTLGIAFPLLTAAALGSVTTPANILKQNHVSRYKMQELLIGMATQQSVLKQLLYKVGQNSTISSLMPELRTISKQLHYDKNASKEFNKVNELLKSSTFKGKASVVSSPGRIVVAYRNLVQERVRLEYTQAMNLLGELDVYVALANKIKAHENENAQFCFVDFVEQSDKPMIKAVDFWNPFVDYKTVVGNDVSLNTGNERNITLTGPNTGGKSTIMKALMFSTLLAQTFGIAPAKSMTMTPFTKLITYLNINDDTGAGISLFKAEINRAKEIIETLRSLPQNEFAFVILDEIFTGTSPDKAEELSYKFITQLNEFKNCIFIDATHLKKITDLEKATNGECKNYYTGVVIEDDKVVKYTYKLVPGVSPISTASQIAQEEGVLDF